MIRLRETLERLSRDRVVKRRLPREFGARVLFVSPDASLRYWRRDLSAVDEGLLTLVDELIRPGERVWDIGANVGLFSFAAAQRSGAAGTVLAIEADPWLAALIKRSEDLGSPAAAVVSVLSAAVSDTVGLAEITTSRRGRSTNHLATLPGSTQTGGVRSVHPVATVTLDALLDRFGAPTFVKIDVEGAEAMCLRAATRVLTEARPRLLCEVATENTAEVTSLLCAHDYTLLDASKTPGERTPCQQAVWATLAIPEIRSSN